MNIRTKHTNNPLTFGLAMTSGIGLILMMVALGYGVIGGSEADGNVVGWTFVVGLTLLILGIVGWLVATQPFRHFDDIDQPKDSGHGHSHGAADHSSAIEVAQPGASAVEPAHH